MNVKFITEVSFYMSMIEMGRQRAVRWGPRPRAGGRRAQGPMWSMGACVTKVVLREVVWCMPCCVGCVMGAVWGRLCCADCVARNVFRGLCDAGCVARNVWYGLCCASCVMRAVWYRLCYADCVVRAVSRELCENWCVSLQWTQGSCVRRYTFLLCRTYTGHLSVASGSSGDLK